MTHILALVGITLLCAAWIKFQLWMKRIDPDKEGFRPGCGACQSGSCSQAGKPNNETEETTVSLPLAGMRKPSGDQ